MDHVGPIGPVVWLVCYLPNVGDQIPDSIWSTKAEAAAYIATKRDPGHWSATRFALAQPGPSAPQV